MFNKILFIVIVIVIVTKFLGVIIDDKLSFIRHITYIKSKISKGLGILLKARKYLNRKCLLNLYYTFIYLYLTYCVAVWGNTPDTHIDPLIKLQKKSDSYNNIISILGAY